MDPTSPITTRMQRLLLRNRAYRRDMAHSPRTGVCYFAEVVMEAKLVLDWTDGWRTNAKRLILEVAPEWVSETTAHRIIKELLTEGMITVDRDPDDGRAVIVTPTEKLLARNKERWERVNDEAAPAPALKLALSCRVVT